jgi:single-strand DNA-binding protein
MPVANLNKVMLIGRLTRDPEMRTFANGGKVAKFGFAVNNRKKNPSTGLWEDEAVFLDCDAFNRGDFGKTADVVEQYLRKGHQAFIEGHLQLDKWADKTTGQERTKLKIVVDNVQFLEPKGADGGASRSYVAGGKPMSAPPLDSPPSDSPDSYDSMPPEPAFQPPPASRPEEEIPF